MKLRQLLIVKLEFPIDDSGQKLSNVNAALEKLIVCPTQLPTIHVRNYALLLYYIRMEIKHISLKNMDAGYTFIVANYIYIYTHIHARAHTRTHTHTHTHQMMVMGWVKFEERISGGTPNVENWTLRAVILDIEMMIYK